MLSSLFQLTPKKSDTRLPQPIYDPKTTLSHEDELRRESSISNDNSKLLRELSAKQRMSLDLFLQQKEITTNDLAIHLGVSKRSAAILIKKSLENNFLIIGNPSNKARTYLLNDKWEELI